MKTVNFRVNSFGFLLLKKSLSLLFISLVSAAFVMAITPIKNLDAEDAQELIKQAEKLSRKGQISEAEKILRRAISQYPQDSPSKLALAYLLLKQKKVIDAYNLAFPVAKAEPQNSFAFAILGTVYLNAGSFPEAEKLLVNSLNINKREALGWASLGMLDFYENRISNSLINLRASVAYNNDEPDFIYALAQVAARAERYTEAAEAYRKFLQISPDNDDERRDRIKGLINFLRFLGDRRSLYDLSGNEKTSIPIILTNDRPIIELHINGNTETLRFVLDTGSGMTVISNETAEKLKIKTVSKGGLARALGGNGKFDIVYGFLRSVEIGEVKIKNVPVYIRQFHQKTDGIDGYIGLSLISKYLTTIDYGNLAFSLVKKDVVEKQDKSKKPADIEKQKKSERSMKFPLRLTSSGFLSGQVLLEGVEPSLNFIVDTGATISVISYDIAAMENIKKFENEGKMRVIGAAGITEDVSSFMLPKVTFGIHSREKIKAIALDLNIINEASGFMQAGILGGNFLKNYSVTFDFEKSEVTFVPNDK